MLLLKTNILATVLALALIAATWYFSHLPAIWAWVNDPAWHWGLVAAIYLGAIDRLVKLTSWRGDDALWAIVKKDILGRKK